MKLLMFLAPRFRYRPFVPASDKSGISDAEKCVCNAAVIFVHAEENDPDAGPRLVTKFVKNVKWIANKRDFTNIVLHSFTHLSESKSAPEFAESFLSRVSEKLSAAGYCVRLTPFGYSCEWELAVHGEPLAKVFKSLK
jgi:hypothetical protein